MANDDTIKKIMQKKEFSQLPLGDVVTALEKFDRPRNAEYQKVKLTRNFLREVFSSFSSRKLLSVGKGKEAEWHLKKHKSSKERFPHYGEVYGRIFQGMKKCSVIDLGSGVNGFAYGFLEKAGLENPKYTAMEAIGQLVENMNIFFVKNRIDGKALHLSLFQKEEVKKAIEGQPKPRVALMLKVIDSLESLKRNYSKEIIGEIAPLCDKIVLSFATKSMGKRRKFSVNRNWITGFIAEKFEILDDFEIEGERYIVFRPRNIGKSL
jgi:hypothetical protein